MTPARTAALAVTLVLLLAAAILTLASVAPSRYLLMMQEDGWAEWATFLSFMAAAVVALVVAVRSKGRRIARLSLFLLAAFSLFVAGEEVSWGQRLFAFQPPEIFLEHNFQQEANVHNLLKNILDTRWMVTIIAVGYGIVLPILARVPRLRPYSELAPPGFLIPAFAVVAILEITYPFDLTGEHAELLLGLTFVVDVAFRVDPTTFIPRATVLQGGALILAIGVGPLVDRVVYGDDEGNVAIARAELSALARDVGAKKLRKKFRKKRRVHKRVYTATRSRYFKFDETSQFLRGDPKRRDRLGFFLDPWQNPYWVLYRRSKRKKMKRLVLYSFGANRRRDTDWSNILDDPTGSGDDIVVEVDLTRASVKTSTVAPISKSQ